MHYAMEHPLVSHASESARAAFIRRTYLHLAGAILVFVGLEALIFNLLSANQLDQYVMQYVRSPLSAMLVLGAFIVTSMIATRMAFSATSPAVQYAGLGLYVLLEVLIFIPLLYMAVFYVRDDTLIPQAGILTLAVFGGLTAAAFITRKDFSFLGPILMIAGFVAIGVIFCAMIFGFGLGLLFSLAMIVLAAGSILYQTSNIIHHYRTDQSVAAALALFAAIATLFYYILLALMQSRR